MLQVGETYDWRLSVANMERRDKYFSRLRARIELLHNTQGEKARAAPPACMGTSAFRCCGSLPLCSAKPWLPKTAMHT